VYDGSTADAWPPRYAATHEPSQASGQVALRRKKQQATRRVRKQARLDQLPTEGVISQLSPQGLFQSHKNHWLRMRLASKKPPLRASRRVSMLRQAKPRSLKPAS